MCTHNLCLRAKIKIDHSRKTITITRLCNIQPFSQLKKKRYFLFLFKTLIECTRLNRLNEARYMFKSKNKENNEQPCKPQFYYIKVGCMVKIKRTC